MVNRASNEDPFDPNCRSPLTVGAKPRGRNRAWSLGRLVITTVLLNLAMQPSAAEAQADRFVPESSAIRADNPLRPVDADPRDQQQQQPDIQVSPPSNPSGHELTLERVAELAKEMRDTPGLAEEVKAELGNRYQAATEWLQANDDARRRIGQYELEIQQGARTIEAVRQELAKAPPEPELPALGDKTVAELEASLQDAEQRLASARTRLGEREAELKNRAERRTEWAKKIEETKERDAEAEDELLLPAPQGETPEVTLARRTETLARQLSLRISAELYQAEIKRLEKLADLFPLQRDLVKRETNLLEKEVAHYQSLVATARKQESERQAREARRQAEMADPALRDIAELNVELAETRKKISEKVTLVTAEVNQIEEQLGRLIHDFDGAKAKVDKAGHSTTVALLLRRQRDVLPRVSSGQQRLRFIEQEMPDVNLQRLELEEAQTMLGDIEAYQEQVLQSLDEQLTRTHGEHLTATVRDLLHTRRDLLDTLVADLDTYLFALGELESNHRSLIDKTRAFHDFIDQHVLWIRSAEPLRLSTVPRLAHGVATLIEPGQWWRLLVDSGLDTIRPSWLAGGLLSSVIALLTFQTRWRRRLRDVCENRANSQGWKFFPVIQSLLLTAAATAGWPMLNGYFGWRIAFSSQVSDFSLSVGRALIHAAGLLWLSGFVRLLCRSEGVAATFFNWPQSGLKVGRNAVRWLTWLGVPLTGIVVGAQTYQKGEWADSIGRVAFVCTMWLLAAFTQATLGSRNNVFREGMAKDTQGWLSQMRTIAYSAGIVLPLMLSVMAIVGYYYSAQQLAIRLQATLGMALISLLVHAVASRWFVVKRRRLAMEQSRERQLALQAASEEGAESSDGTVATPVVKDTTDWAAVHERLRLLLRQAITVGIVLGGWLIWSDVLPALRILDNVELWSKNVEVVEQFEDTDGNLRLFKDVESTRTTLRHVVIAGMILLATVILGRNLPALLEITVLNRLPLDRGGRHAVSIISYYAVALTGLIVALRTLDINWASVQWLAAGITVGLGFGLQEIFANFVSGMILLFERPIRVGDIITLGDVTGSVTSIRIRATTVTNWDRKELIVPNKDLVTGRLLNWTLSDTLNRIVIDVAIPFHSDPSRARQVMEQVVGTHPNVLADPAPVVTFTSFSDGTLKFVIRVYLASMDVRLQTIHELHIALHQKLLSEGIGIALPQRDIHVRGMEATTPSLVPDHLPITRRSDAA